LDLDVLLVLETGLSLLGEVSHQDEAGGVQELGSADASVHLLAERRQADCLYHVFALEWFGVSLGEVLGSMVLSTKYVGQGCLASGDKGA
jgi:hypothetical protein